MSELEHYSTMDNERYHRESSSYPTLFREPVEIRFGTVFKSLGGGVDQKGVVRNYYGTGMVARINGSTSFEQADIDIHYVDGEPREYVFGGGTLLRPNVLEVTGRIISLEEYLRMFLEADQEFIERWGYERAQGIERFRDPEINRQKLLEVARRALKEIAKGTVIMPGVEVTPLPIQATE